MVSRPESPESPGHRILYRFLVGAGIDFQISQLGSSSGRGSEEGRQRRGHSKERTRGRRRPDPPAICSRCRSQQTNQNTLGDRILWTLQLIHVSIRRNKKQYHMDRETITGSTFTLILDPWTDWSRFTPQQMRKGKVSRRTHCTIGKLQWGSGHRNLAF